MRITEIKQKRMSKNRYQIFVDGEFFAIILDETIYKHHLNTNHEYEKEELLKIVQDGQLPLALDTAYTILSSYNKTEREMRQKLKEKGFVDNVIDTTIKKLKANNYINDSRYAEYYVSSHKTKGKKAIKFELQQKGVANEIIVSILNKIENQKDIIEQIAKKFIKNKKNDPKIREKLYRHLASKGFEYEEIKSVLNICNKLNDFNNDEI